MKNKSKKVTADDLSKNDSLIKSPLGRIEDKTLALSGELKVEERDERSDSERLELIETARHQTDEDWKLTKQDGDKPMIRDQVVQHMHRRVGS